MSSKLSTPAIPVSDGISCPACGYDLTGLPHDRCPECGMVGARAEYLRLRRERGRHVGAGRWATAFLAIGTALPALAWPDDLGIGVLLAGVVLACCVPALAWRIWDAEARGERVATGTCLALLAAPHVMLASYLVRCRRWRELAIGLICCLAAVSALGTARGVYEALRPRPGPYVICLF